MGDMPPDTTDQWQLSTTRANVRASVVVPSAQERHMPRFADKPMVDGGRSVELGTCMDRVERVCAGRTSSASGCLAGQECFVSRLAMGDPRALFPLSSRADRFSAHLRRLATLFLPTNSEALRLETRNIIFSCWPYF
ncbi:hypothetical protein BC835DRAFT_304901 [Cytidiella melzeri]|nr:hypothetical protein BC835DRAFT_304901 [Cytidiella melzeri]